MKTIDARGLSCPEPVILTRKALASGDSSYEIIVDNPASRENVTRFAEHQGYRVSVREDGGEYTLSLSK
ncbi:MAG: sulfurtransferase TusA family protein [Stomatobaculum sp.]|nr:sulfurtransferase TusA family protein [Stomatobaculum sp.]